MGVRSLIHAAIWTVSIDAILQQFEHFGVKLGLEAIQQLLAALDNPHEQVPIVHVAGSNGKGSVCAYLSAVLTAAGYRVGRYTSPHLIRWCERICIDDQPIAEAELEAVLEQVIAAIPSQEDSPTQFEVITAAAWLYFAQQEVDIAVIEVGLGGRLDATNVCEYPLVSVITSLSREHWQRLGPTLADIAGEKAGILKPECPVVLGQFSADAEAVVNRRAAELGCPVTYAKPARDLGNGWAEYWGVEEYVMQLDPAEVEKLEAAGVDVTNTEYLSQVEKTIQYRLPLQGAIQLHNSALAIATLFLLRGQGWEISDEAIVQGIAKTRWPGRLQWFTWNHHRILVDGAHNPASATVLRQFVDTLPPVPVHWVMGMLSTKDHADIFKELLRSGDRLFLTSVPDHSAAAPQELATLAQSICPDLADCQIYPDVLAALEAATLAGAEPSPKPLTVLCGSLYLIGHFLALNAPDAEA